MVEGVDEEDFLLKILLLRFQLKGQVFNGEISQHFTEPDGYHYRKNLKTEAIL